VPDDQGAIPAGPAATARRVGGGARRSPGGGGVPAGGRSRHYDAPAGTALVLANVTYRPIGALTVRVPLVRRSRLSARWNTARCGSPILSRAPEAGLRYGRRVRHSPRAQRLHRARVAHCSSRSRLGSIPAQMRIDAQSNIQSPPRGRTHSERYGNPASACRTFAYVSTDGRSLENPDIGSPPTPSENVPSPIAIGRRDGCWDWRTS